MTRSGPSLLSSLVHFLLSLSPLYFLSTTSQRTPSSFKDVSLANPIIHLVPSSIRDDGFSCERVKVTGTSRLNLKSYSNSLRVTVNASGTVPERLYGKIEVCIHRNASMGLCQCGGDNWKILQNGEWGAVISPYEKRYVDVKFKGQVFGGVTISVEEEFQQWRLIFLGVGFSLLLFAPRLSTCVPFYFSSSMACGTVVVMLLLLFQAMKLLPMGRKNILYITLYGSVLGVGSYIANYFSTVVNSILVSFGLSEEMYNPVSVFLLVGIVLAGAALGYWIVRKYVISDDGSVHAGISLFVKWALRVLAVVFVFQSSLDHLFPVVALVIWCICSLVTSKLSGRRERLQHRHPRNRNLRQQNKGQTSTSIQRAEFLSRPSFGRSVLRSPNSPYASLSNSRLRANSFSSPNKQREHQPDEYYSTFHKTPTRHKFSKTEWGDFTRESTRDALSDWASSPEGSKWIADNAHRMRLEPEDNSDDSMDSSSGSSEETVVENGSGLGLFNWY